MKAPENLDPPRVIKSGEASKDLLGVRAVSIPMGRLEETAIWKSSQVSEAVQALKEVDLLDAVAGLAADIIPTSTNVKTTNALATLDAMNANLNDICLLIRLRVFVDFA